MTHPGRWSRLHWWLIPLAVWAATECYFRVQRARGGGWEDNEQHLQWYARAAQVAQRQPASAIFIGSSRTAAAVDANVVAGRLRERGGPTNLVFGLANGYSTLREHFLGLRNMITAAPGCLSNAVVVIEMPGNQLIAESASSPWSSREWPNGLLAVLMPGDEASFLKGSDPWMIKARIWSAHTARHFPVNRISTLVAYRARIRTWYLNRANDLLIRAIPALQRPSPETASQADLSDAGGIRTDPAHVAMAQKLATRKVAEWLSRQKLITEDACGLNRDIIELVESNGGRVLFLHMPVNSLFAKLSETEIGKENLKRSRAYVEAWHSQILETGLEYGDEDFPDAWHLSRSHRREFSTAVADALLAATARPGP